MKPPSHRAVSLANVSSEWGLLFFLLAASLPPLLFRHNSLVVASKLDLLDGSWVLDTSYKASAGIWLGRDVAFTYGPLFQWLSSAPARWIGISMGAIYATWHTLPLLLVVVSTFLTVRLLLPDAAPWRRAVLLLLAVVFWSPPDARFSICLLAFAIFVRMTDAVACGKPVVMSALAAALICTAAFWFSADTGTYTAASLLLCAAATGLLQRQTPRMALFLLTAAAFLLALVLLTNAALFSLFDFSFWRSSFAIAGGYRWFEPDAMAKSDKHLLLESLGLGVVVFGAAWRWRQPGGAWTRRPAFLLSAACLAFLILQTALVRSDHGHIIAGIYSVLFLCGAIAMGELRGPLSIALPVAAVIATLALASAYPLYRPASVLSRARQIESPLQSCPAETQEFDQTCFPLPAAKLLTDVSTFANAQTAPGEPIAVFPYETAFGLASRHQVAGGVLQSYLVNGEYLTSLELAGLRRSHPPLALYFPDGEISDAIDSVSNFTRSPEVWFYLLKNYRTAGSPSPGVVGLLHDDGRAARLSFTQQSVADATGLIAIRKRSNSIELPLRNWPAEGADFLKLRVQVNCRVWWHMRKPSKLAVLLSFADGTEKTSQFVLEPNHPGEVWIYPWDDLELARYFTDDESQWRTENRPALIGMKLLVYPYDWISVVPSSISVERIEAVTVHLR